METLERNQSLTGLGGWLIWFQIRIYLGVGNAISYLSRLNSTGQMVTILLFILIAVVLVQFYSKMIIFRYTYIAVIVVNAATLMFSGELGYMIGVIIIEGLIIFALFRSQRVKNTFI